MRRYREIAYLLLRLAVGMMFLFYGVGKFFQGLDEFSSGLVESFSESPLPAFLVEPFAYLLPFIEVTVGLLLVLGLFTRFALIATGVLMLALTFGTVMEPDPAGVGRNINYVLVISVLLWLSDYDRYSVDFMRRRSHT